MNDMLKKGFFLGLGAASYGKEKVQTYIDDLVTRGRITPREAEQWKQELIERGKHMESDWSGRSKDKARDAFRDLGLASDTDIERIETKLHELENKLEQYKDNAPDNNED
ncbi:phasin family protein [Salibacterium qingdaonense]|uniref:Polyhydroxyalkanoate synthesis regulator phasin n=1 Tax=Salibacterium qingdaonense TaxID=266892 RepID=A0A1I4JZA0_9BACI|nr:hypothetical protein [Salibacterium qingdaonense]SFL71845.1 Polyhydroxyalkanoate synthesis regulator phasin [Salibacterium qingdaonense]